MISNGRPQGLARAAGLDIDECHGAPVNVRVESGELQPAAPNLVLVLHGKVRGWICKPFKTQLTPELDVDARTTLSIDVSAQHVVTIVPSSTRIDVRRLDNLGAVGGPIRSVIGSLENKVQAELAAELARHALPLDKLAAPFSISSPKPRNQTVETVAPGSTVALAFDADDAQGNSPSEREPMRFGFDGRGHA